MDAKSGRKKHASCDTCEKADKLRKCGNCGMAWYCSKECQVAAWQGHKANCKLWQQQVKKQQQEKQQRQANKQQQVATAGSSSSTGRAAAAAAAAAVPAMTSADAAHHGSAEAEALGTTGSTATTTTTSSSSTRHAKPAAVPSTSSSTKTQLHAAQNTPNRGNLAAAAAAAGSSTAAAPAAVAASSTAADNDKEFEMPFRYRTKADPTKADLESPLYFTQEELAALAEVYPGMLYDGDRYSINLDRYIIKKIKTWHIQYLFRKQMRPSPGNNEDNIPFFRGLMNGDILIVSAKSWEKEMKGPIPVRRNSLDYGVAGVMSMMLEHGPKGIANHPRGMPKIMICEPDEYSDIRLI